jgi:hypothetical protein
MSTKTRNILLFILFLLVGCTSDYKISKPAEENEPGITVPEIDVNPLAHSFGALSAGSETQDAVITIRNEGNGDLDVTGIYLAGGSSNFSITTISTGIIESLDEVELVVSYAPGTYETNSDIIHIISNDADEPIVDVFLDGSGDAPVIFVTPDYHDFGTVYLGCDDIIPVTIGNIGNSNLILSDIEYFASIPVDFSMEDYVVLYGEIPITIPPGDNIEISVGYKPDDILDDDGYIEITSNDPATPIVWADQDGLGDYESWQTDSFTQDGSIDVDILFVIDNSGSMGSNQTNIKNNFDSFMTTFGAAGVSYHIALITTDSSDFIGPIITSLTVDPLTEFNDQIDLIGTRGSAQEKGLWFAYESTTSGDASPGSATGFFRSDARLVVVYVSDEPDNSTYTYDGSGSTTMTPSDYSSSLLSLKSSMSLVAAHAIAGDYPSGCSGNGHATFGDGYYDVVNDLGGTFMSICASDWSVTMDTLARESIAITDFPLTGTPIESSIEVTVGGYVSTDWLYDAAANSITMTITPAEGSSIDITYAILATCDDE